MRRLSNPGLLVALLATIFTIALSACGGTTASTSSTSNSARPVTLVTDIGGINDQSFNQSAYSGYQQAMKHYGFHNQVIETQSESDYIQNLT